MISIRRQDLNNNTDTETRCLVYLGKLSKKRSKNNFEMQGVPAIGDSSLSLCNVTPAAF